jgi:Na+-driven multidrug efflux pump
MALLYSLFFGAGVAAFVYSRFARRVGYGNTQNVATIVGVVFILTTIIFFTIIVTLLHA